MIRMFYYLYLFSLISSLPITSQSEPSTPVSTTSQSDPNTPVSTLPPPPPRGSPEFNKAEAIVLSILVLLFGLFVIVFVVLRRRKGMSENNGTEKQLTGNNGNGNTGNNGNGNTYSSLFRRMRENGIISSLWS